MLTCRPKVSANTKAVCAIVRKMARRHSVFAKEHRPPTLVSTCLQSRGRLNWRFAHHCSRPVGWPWCDQEMMYEYALATAKCCLVILKLNVTAVWTAVSAQAQLKLAMIRLLSSGMWSRINVFDCHRPCPYYPLFVLLLHIIHPLARQVTVYLFNTV